MNRHGTGGSGAPVGAPPAQAMEPRALEDAPGGHSEAVAQVGEAGARTMIDRIEGDREEFHTAANTTEAVATGARECE